jgi:tetratricopeptide (TPR) repeat protein
MEDYDQALPYLEEGISLYKNTRQNNVMRVLQKNEIIVYEYLGMFDKALNKLQAYVATYPKDEEAKRELAFIKSRLE